MRRCRITPPPGARPHPELGIGVFAFDVDKRRVSCEAVRVEADSWVRSLFRPPHGLKLSGDERFTVSSFPARYLAWSMEADEEHDGSAGEVDSHGPATRTADDQRPAADVSGDPALPGPLAPLNEDLARATADRPDSLLSAAAPPDPSTTAGRPRARKCAKDRRPADRHVHLWIVQTPAAFYVFGLGPINDHEQAHLPPVVRACVETFAFDVPPAEITTREGAAA